MPPAEQNGGGAKRAPSADLDHGAHGAAAGAGVADAAPPMPSESRGLHTRTLSFSELQR